MNRLKDPVDDVYFEEEDEGLTDPTDDDV